MTLALPITNVPLDKPRGAFKPCMWCGGESATFEESPAIDPAHHAARVKCEGCGRQIAWASERHVRKASRLTTSQNVTTKSEVLA